MCGIILMVIFGLVALFVGEFKIVGKRKVKGPVARVLGLILLGGAGIAVLAQIAGIGASSLEQATLISGFGNLVCIGAFLIVVVVGLAASTTEDSDTTASTDQ